VRLLRLLSTFAALSLASLAAMAQVNDTYVIPVSGNAPGAYNTRWMTQFSVMNPHFDHSLTVSVTLLPTGGGVGVEKLIDLPANALAYSDNILDDLFDRTGSGALLVAAFAEDNPGVPDTVADRAFLVNTSTYNNASSGTYGQTIPGVWTGLLDIDYDGISSVAHGIRSLTKEGWRTNIGAVNLGRCTATLYVTAYDADGRTILQEAPFYVPPLGHIQDRLPLEQDLVSVEFYVDDPCVDDDAKYAIVFPYTSTIDQLSGDPSYQSPTLLALPKNLYAKGGVASQAASIDPVTVGKKVDSTYAAGIRSTAKRAGRAMLVREGARLHIR
jgi:hypothetical protein